MNVLRPKFLKSKRKKNRRKNKK